MRMWKTGRNGGGRMERQTVSSECSLRSRHRGHPGANGRGRSIKRATGCATAACRVGPALRTDGVSPANAPASRNEVFGVGPEQIVKQFGDKFHSERWNCSCSAFLVLFPASKENGEHNSYLARKRRLWGAGCARRPASFQMRILFLDLPEMSRSLW